MGQGRSIDDEQVIAILPTDDDRFRSAGDRHRDVTPVDCGHSGCAVENTLSTKDNTHANLKIRPNILI